MASKARRKRGYVEIMRAKTVRDFFEQRQIKVWLSCGHNEVLTLVQVEGRRADQLVGEIRKCERCVEACKLKAVPRKKEVAYACVP